MSEDMLVTAYTQFRDNFQAIYLDCHLRGGKKAIAAKESNIVKEKALYREMSQVFTP